MRGPETSADSITEAITGLPDGRVFTVMLERKVALARRTLKPVSVIFFEIDEFDSFAPYIREHAMRATSRVITNTLRESDTVCGISAGTLGALLDDTSEAGAIWAANRIRQANAEGVACYPIHAMDGEDLIDAARAACQRAAEHGPGRIQVATNVDSL